MAGPTTATKLRVLIFIVDHLEHNRASPTRDEIAVAVGLSGRSAVQYHIDKLVKGQYLERPVYRHRMIWPTDAGKRLVETWRDNES